MGGRIELENGWAIYRAIALPEEIVEQCKQDDWQAEQCGSGGEEQAFEAREPKAGSASSSETYAREAWESPLKDFAGPKLRLVDADQVEADFVDVREGYGSSDDRDRQRKILKRLRKGGEYRRLAVLPEDWETALLARLRSRFPNFVEVIDYLHGMFTLAALGDRVPRFDPILLSGPPGVGKTYFAESLSLALGSGFVLMRMENAQDNSALTGSSEFWANTKESHLLSWLLNKDVGNPVFFLDELDKVAGDLPYNPMSSLYSLLEQKTAASFTDLSFPWLKLNASGVLWIATANEPDLLPAPILSRFRNFYIPAPTPSQSRRLVAQIFQAIRGELPEQARSLRLTKGAIDLLSTQSPRWISRLLREAVGRTLIAKRDRITMRDISVAPPEKRSGIGFVDL